jgi:hypothetical protein
MATLINKLFGGNSGKKSSKDFGFKACGSCTTDHTSACTAIDDELVKAYDLDPADPRFPQMLARAKEITMGSPAKGPGG